MGDARLRSGRLMKEAVGRRVPGTATRNACGPSLCFSVENVDLFPGLEFRTSGAHYRGFLRPRRAPDAVVGLTCFDSAAANGQAHCFFVLQPRGNAFGGRLRAR